MPMHPQPDLAQPRIASLSGDTWTLMLGHVHDRSRGAIHDKSDVPADLPGHKVAATVPGCVHTDLLAAGWIPDPYLDQNELHLLWIGRCDWSYTRSFELSAADLAREHLELCFDGLDTVAVVSVNGVELGRTANMHRRYRFDLKDACVGGSNTLEVAFAAPLPAAWDEQDRLGELPRAGGGSNPSHPHNMLRKMACNMGWDWGPVLPTCGIWRDIRVEAWNVGRLGDVRPIVRSATEALAVVDIEADVQGRGDVRATLTAPDGSSFEGTHLEIENPKRWFPVGHGQQPLYTLRVELHDGNTLLDVREQRVGLREVTLDTTADVDRNGSDWPVDGLGSGNAMQLVVNGRPVYCKGANWIPDDAFPHRVTPDRYAKRIDQAVEANMNMLRVWGGGLYESNDFYELCDEKGVMVWQDFLFACAAYHEDESTHRQVEAESRDNVSRLTRHPSLVLWNGCNENLMGHHSWHYDEKSWESYIGDRGWGLAYYYGVLDKATRELAPATPYWPASPSNGTTLDDFIGKDPNANERGNRHVWNVWHGPGHYLNYLGHYPRFCSEFGFHGPAAWATLERAIPEHARRWDSDAMRLHNKNGITDIGDGQDKSTARMGDDFEVPDAVCGDAFDDWLYLSQVMQARALTVGVGWYRSLFPWNSGSLFWQLNDCWPCASWSAIDGDGRAKPMLHAARRFFAPRVVNIGPREPTQVGGWDEDAGPLRVFLHNDADATWQTALHLRRFDYDGIELDAHEAAVTVQPRAAATVDVPTDWHRRDDTFLVADAAGGERAFWWFAPDKHAPMPTPRFEAKAADDGRSVTVTARTLVRDLCLLADRLHPSAEADDACVTLLPGESVTFTIDTPVALDPEALTRRPVLRCIGDRAGADDSPVVAGGEAEPVLAGHAG